MNSLIKTTIKRPVTVCVLVIILLAVGVLATLDMSTNLLPDIALPMMGISVVYPGAGAQSVEKDVTSVLSGALQTVPGIKQLETSSYDNVAVAVLTFDYGTDIDKKIDTIEDTLKKYTFPEGCEDPTYVKIDMNGTATATVAVFNPQGDVDALTANANALATKLRAIEGVGSVDVLGTYEQQIKITALQGLDITSLLIVQALQSENSDIPLGTIMQDGTVVSVRNASDATSVLDVMQLPATLELGAGAVSSFATIQNGVRVFATCTKQQFDDYVQKARDARSVIDEIDGKTADELAEQQQSLTSVKTLMTLLRDNTSGQLEWLKKDLLLYLDRHQSEIVSWDEADYQAAAERFENQYNVEISADTLQWVCERYLDGTLEQDFDKMIAFREIFPTVDTNDDGILNGDDITYEQFAYLFQDGAVDMEVPDGDTTKLVTFEGLDILHSDVKHGSAADDADCDRESFSHQRATDICQFADSVNTVAYNDIIQTKRDAEQNGTSAEISDEQYSALFFNSTQGNDFAALLSPQVIHVIRKDNFDDGSGNSTVDILTEYKLSHVNADGDAVYKNGQVLTRNADDEIVVYVNGRQYKTDNFGRLVNADGKLVNPDTDQVLRLTDAQKENNYRNYLNSYLEGCTVPYNNYIIFTDQELLDLYSRLDIDTDLGITPTADTVRFMRLCDFTANADKLIVPLAYVGNVQRYQNRQSFAQHNGHASVTLKVFANSDADTTEVVKQVRKIVEGSNYQSKVLLLDDKAQFISDSITNVLSSIIIGGVLAVLIIYLFVRKVGSSLVVSITMPLSVLVALLGLWAMKISLNMVSLGGLAVGIGMLVDNSIVVLESITKHRDNGESVFDSCLNGTREVAGSLLASTLTNICVFMPILFTKGLTREIFYDLVWAVTFSIVMSLIVAVTVIPSLYHLIYKNSNRPRYKKVNGQKVLVGSFESMEPNSGERVLLDGTQAVKLPDSTAPQPEPAADAPQQPEPNGNGKKRKKRKIDWHNPQAIRKMENGYAKLLGKLLKKRVIVCVVALVVFGASVGLLFVTGTEFLPSVDKGLIEVNMAFDTAATLDECQQAGTDAAKIISDKYGDKLEYVSLTIGKQGILGTNLSNVLRVQLNTKKLKTAQTVQEIRTLLKQSGISAQSITVKEIDGVVAEVTGGMSGQSVTLLSDDMDALRSAAGEIAQKLQSVKGIASVTDKTAKTTKEYSFNFDKTACAERGVDYKNAVLMLRVGMSGYTAANVKIDGESQDVVVQFVDATKDDMDALTNIVVGFDDDGAVRLSDVLQRTSDGQLYTTGTVVSVIEKQDGKYVTTIEVESYATDTGTISKRIKKTVDEVLKKYPQVTFEEGGVAAYLTDAFNGLVVSLIAAFLLLYGVMACQFESLLKPFIVIMAIPLGFTGGFLALAMTQTTLNVVSFVGLIMLMGVIVNDAIVLVDKIDMLIAEGMAPQQAVIEAGRSRLRPILMTTLTTVLALIPLALGLGRGGELMQPMGIVVIGGMTLGTLVTLVLIPSFYCIVKRISFKNWGDPQPAESQLVSDENSTEISQPNSAADETQPDAEVQPAKVQPKKNKRKNN